MIFSTLTCTTSQTPGVYGRHTNQSTICSSAVLLHINIYMLRYVTCFGSLTARVINLVLHLQKGRFYCRGYVEIALAVSLIKKLVTSNQ